MDIKIGEKGKILTSINLKRPIEKKIIVSSPEDKPESLTEQKDLTMKVSKREGVLKSIKTGITTNFTAPFGLALGLSPSLVVFLTSIPQLLGSISILVVESLIRFAHKRKRVMVFASYLESYTWLLVLAMAALSLKNPILLIFLVALDAIFINIQYPIWNSIMGDTVPENKLGKYFGLRHVLVGIASLLSMIIAGLILHSVTNTNSLIGFAIIFGIAFIASYYASRYQSKMIDPTPEIKKSPKYSFKEFILTIKENNFGMYTWFYATFQMVVNMAAPFFTIYMLKVLNFDYLTFTLVTMASIISALASMSLWGKIIDRVGSKKIMSITSFLIPGVPLLWLLTTNWKILIAVEIFSGIVWAGFNLSCSTFMFESVKPEYKVKFYTYNKVLYGVGVFLGSILGILLIRLPPIIFASSILLAFLISGILRLVVALIFIPRIQEEKVVTINFKEGNMFHHAITLRPKSGVMFEIVGHGISSNTNNNSNDKINKKKIKENTSKDTHKEEKTKKDKIKPNVNQNKEETIKMNRKYKN
ncbi:MAG: MFS transporter [Candidatus Woesearchaeota archaeon]